MWIPHALTPEKRQVHFYRLPRHALEKLEALFSVDDGQHASCRPDTGVPDTRQALAGRSLMSLLWKRPGNWTI
jgi:hypothetical protein